MEIIDAMNTQAPSWWSDAVVYQVYPRSFADDNGDGTGALRGIVSKLDYLRDLGVDAIWLTPFYPSPLADGGYDVADYCDVDPRFGTLGDFDALVLGLRAEVPHQFLARDAFGEAGEILDLGREHELAAGNEPARVEALDAQRFQVRARRVDRRGEARGA